MIGGMLFCWALKEKWLSGRFERTGEDCNDCYGEWKRDLTRDR